MKGSFFKRILSCLAGAMLIALGFQFPADTQAGEVDHGKELQVVTTLFPLYDWARVIGGDQAHVVLLLPPGVEAHSWEPTPRDMVGIHKADLLIYTGRLMEPWVENVAKGVDHDRLLVVDTSRGILGGEVEHHNHHGQDHEYERHQERKDGHDHVRSDDAQHEHNHHQEKKADHHHRHHGGQDPHIWLEFSNAQIMVTHIARGFAQKDPERAQLYLDRAAQYNAWLKELDQNYENALASCRHKTLIYAGHFAFGYFAERYGFTHVSPYAGFSPSAEPSPRRIAELIETMKATGMRAVFYEEGVEPRVARVIGKETGARLLLLHGAHNVTKDELDQGVTYLSIMEDNLDRLKEGLECP